MTRATESPDPERERRLVAEIADQLAGYDVAHLGELVALVLDRVERVEIGMAAGLRLLRLIAERRGAQ